MKTFIFTIFDAPLLLAGSCRAIHCPAGKIAGHANIATTRKHYTSIDAQIVQSFTEKMNAIYRLYADTATDDEVD
ncbi:MAG: hypothetical protein IPG67_16825 [Acidobacteria bacterium]|nr:hypothetical protein [Acidobacteriota bacterium]